MVITPCNGFEKNQFEFAIEKEAFFPNTFIFAPLFQKAMFF